jgi:hypothetical protein
MIAVCNSQVDLVDWLLRNGANPELQNEDGNTALHLAALKHLLPIVERLLNAGVSREVKNSAGQAPIAMVDSTYSLTHDRLKVPVLQFTDTGRRIATLSPYRQPSPNAPELRRLLSSPDAESLPETTPTP